MVCEDSGYIFLSINHLINYIMRRKFEVKFYKPTRVSRFVCTRTYVSCVKFALSRFLRGYGLFTIKRIK